MVVMTQKTSLTPKIQPLWISCHRTTLPEGDNDSADEYFEENDTCHLPLTNLLQQFQQFKNQFASLKSNTFQSTPREELSQLTDKLQQLTLALQSTPSPVRNL